VWFLLETDVSLEAATEPRDLGASDAHGIGTGSLSIYIIDLTFCPTNGQARVGAIPEGYWEYREGSAGVQGRAKRGADAARRCERRCEVSVHLDANENLTTCYTRRCQKHHNLAKWPAYGVFLRRVIPDGSPPLLDAVNRTAALHQLRLDWNPNMESSTAGWAES
jgi:hypothetical protein